MKTDVVVVNYRTPEDLENFCESLVSQSGVGIVTIVNNAPRDADREVADRYIDRIRDSTGNGASAVNFDNNIGYARAVNAAVRGVTAFRWSKAPVVAIFNADVILTEDAIAKMAGFMEVHPDVGIAGPRQIDDRGRITHGGIVGTNRRPVHRGWHRKDQGQFSDVIIGTVTVSGSAYFVRRECWDQLTNCRIYRDAVIKLTGSVPDGAFLPTNHFYEETFCSVHAAAHGWKNAYNGNVQIIHLWQRATPSGEGLGKHVAESRKLYRAACDAHGIIRE